MCIIYENDIFQNPVEILSMTQVQAQSFNLLICSPVEYLFSMAGWIATFPES